MPYSRPLYALATVLFGILSGIGHLAVELFAPRTPESLLLSETMANVSVNLAGTQTNAYLLTFGVSIIMGLMLFAYGVVNLLILRQLPKGQLPSRAIQATNVVVAALAFVLALKYLFIIPVVLTGSASVLFLIILATNLKTAQPA